MKKNLKYAMLGAIALTGTMEFTACSDDTVGQEAKTVTPSPGYNPETGEVTADFVFNVAMGSNQKTRMSSYFTQADAVNSTGLDETSQKWFRGIDNAKLFSYKLKVNTGTPTNPNWVTSDGNHLYEVRPDDGSHECKLYDLGVAIAENGLAPAGTGTTKSRRILELALPTETNALMFYGKAIRSGSATNFQQGKTDMAISDDGDINKHLLSLVKVVPDNRKASLLQYENLIQTALTKIVQTQVDLSAQSMDSRTWPGGKIKWADYVVTTPAADNVTITSIEVADKTPVQCTGEASARNMDGLSEILAQTYKTFNTIYDVGGHNELRAGAGPDIQRMLKDLYNIVKSVADATATNVEDKVAMLLASQICSNISAIFETSESFPWKNIQTMQTFTGLTDAQLSTIADKTARLSDFPKTEFGLPYGAVILKFVYNATKGEGEYKYMSNIPTYAMGTGAAFDPFNYAYPPELCYFGNSSVNVTDNEKVQADYPDGTSAWANAANPLWSDWTKDGHVLSSTRAVAMKDCINYGNALLKTTIKYGTGVLKDNNAQIQLERTHAVEEDNVIKVNTADGATTPFTLSGILVGGQNPTVNWCYLPTGNKLVGGVVEEHDPSFDYMVYDNAIGGAGIIPVPATATDEGAITPANYTLLWDNYVDEAEQNKVYVALEFVNNSGVDFWGMNNLIKAGATFYVTAKLDPDAVAVAGPTAATDKSAGIEWPTAYQMPPYYTTAEATNEHPAGTTKKIRRVFMQDYVTEANFVITENTLKYALVAVPDLRTTQLSLGLSVDLQWRQGLVFDGVPVGGN